jgi:hypothetical protein
MVAPACPSSASLSGVGYALTALPLYCWPCQHPFVEILRGAVLRVNGQYWLFSPADTRPLPKLTCPLCRSTQVHLRHDL